MVQAGSKNAEEVWPKQRHRLHGGEAVVQFGAMRRFRIEYLPVGDQGSKSVLVASYGLNKTDLTWLAHYSVLEGKLRDQ